MDQTNGNDQIVHESNSQSFVHNLEKVNLGENTNMTLEYSDQNQAKIEPGNTLQWNLSNTNTLENNMNNFMNKLKADDATSDTSDEGMREELNMMMASDDEGNEKQPELKYRTKNEQALPGGLLNIDETLEDRYKRFQIDPTQVNNLEPIGVIEFIMNEYITVRSQSEKVLDLEGMLFTQDKIPLGPIDDVFGKIDIPYYTIFNDKFLKQKRSNNEIKIGDIVYFDQYLTKILPPTQINILKAKKGCDASNQFDEEALYGEEIEFSDDEKEEQFNRVKKGPRKDKGKSKLENKKEFRNYQKNQTAPQNLMFNQGMGYLPQQNQHMYPQQMYPMNQFQSPNSGQFPLNGQVMQPQMNPVQNMPLFFSPMGQNGQSMNQPMPNLMQGFQSYPQVYMPNNNMYQNPHNY